MRAILPALFAASLFPSLCQAFNQKDVDPASLKECTAQNSVIEKPFYYVANCKTAFEYGLGQSHRWRAIKVCEKQRSEVAIWCRDRLRGSNDESRTDQIRQRGVVIRVLQDLVRQ